MAYQTEVEEKAVWNIDDEILKIIKDLKVMFLIHIKNWQLEEAYWTLSEICMECDAKLNEEQRTEVRKELQDVEAIRKDLRIKNNPNEEHFFVCLRDLYQKINLLMKEHGVWFREMEDDVGL